MNKVLKMLRLCIISSRTYSADYSTNNVNEATLVRDTIENLFKMYFPSTTLTKSVGADFFVVSNKANHVLLSLAAKSNKTKGMNDLTKLCREFEERPELFGLDVYWICHYTIGRHTCSNPRCLPSRLR